MADETTNQTPSVTITTSKPGIWGSFKSWVSGISQKIWAAFFPFLKTEAAHLISDAFPIFVAGIKAANASQGTSSDEKRRIAQAYIIENLKPLGKTYSTSIINTGIEIAYQTVKEETGVDVKSVVDSIKK